MKKLLVASIVLMLSIVFVIVESQANLVHFPSWVLFLKNWLHPFFFLPLLGFYAKDIKEHSKTSKLSLMIPTLLCLFSIILIVIKIRNEMTYLLSAESLVLKY